MKLATLVRIELIKTLHRRAFWVALAFLALISTVMAVSELRDGRSGSGAPFVPPFTWAQAASEMGPMPGFFLALTLAMLITSEFSWRTARQNVIDGLSKEQFFVAKWLMTLMVGLAFMAVAFGMTTATGLYGRIYGATPSAAAADSTAARPDSAAQARALAARADSTRQALAAARTAQDSARVIEARQADSTTAALRQQLRDARAARPRAVYPAPDPAAPLVSLSDLKVAGGMALGSLGLGSMAFMLAILLRSTGGAIGVFFLYFAFLEQLVALLFRQVGGQELVQKVAPYLPLNVMRGPMNPNVWHAEYVDRLNSVAASVGQPPVTTNFDAGRVIGLPLAWIAVFVLVSFIVFRKRDL